MLGCLLLQKRSHSLLLRLVDMSRLEPPRLMPSPHQVSPGRHLWPNDQRPRQLLTRVKILKMKLMLCLLSLPPEHGQRHSHQYKGGELVQDVSKQLLNSDLRELLGQLQRQRQQAVHVGLWELLDQAHQPKEQVRVVMQMKGLLRRCLD